MQSEAADETDAAVMNHKESGLLHKCLQGNLCLIELGFFLRFSIFFILVLIFYLTEYRVLGRGLFQLLFLKLNFHVGLYTLIMNTAAVGSKIFAGGKAQGRAVS